MEQEGYIIKSGNFEPLIRKINYKNFRLLFDREETARLNRYASQVLSLGAKSKGDDDEVENRENKSCPPPQLVTGSNQKVKTALMTDKSARANSKSQLEGRGGGR